MSDEYIEVEINCPKPRVFFKTTGVGQSPDQIHAGSYHDAMADAGVQGANLMSYTSILPAKLREVSVKAGMKAIEHGCEMKVIQAVSHIDLKDPKIKEAGIKRVSSAILYGWLQPSDNPTGPHVGGLVCEYGGHGTKDEAFENLERCIKRIYTRVNKDGTRYEEKGELKIQPMMYTSLEPKEQYGTALCALAFVRYAISIPKQKIPPALAELVKDQLVERGL